MTNFEKLSAFLRMYKVNKKQFLILEFNPNAISPEDLSNIYNRIKDEVDTEVICIPDILHVESMDKNILAEHLKNILRKIEG